MTNLFADPMPREGWVSSAAGSRSTWSHPRFWCRRLGVSRKGTRWDQILFVLVAYVTLARRLHALAPRLTPRSVLEKFAAVQMIDVHLPTTDGRELLLTAIPNPNPSSACC